jgi:hypothetical protein
MQLIFISIVLSAMLLFPQTTVDTTGTSDNTETEIINDTETINELGQNRDTTLFSTPPVIKPAITNIELFRNENRALFFTIGDEHEMIVTGNYVQDINLLLPPGVTIRNRLYFPAEEKIIFQLLLECSVRQGDHVIAFMSEDNEIRRESYSFRQKDLLYRLSEALTVLYNNSPSEQDFDWIESSLNTITLRLESKNIQNRCSNVTRYISLIAEFLLVNERNDTLYLPQFLSSGDSIRLCIGSKTDCPSEVTFNITTHPDLFKIFNNLRWGKIILTVTDIGTNQFIRTELNKGSEYSFNFIYNNNRPFAFDNASFGYFDGAAVKWSNEIAFIVDLFQWSNYRSIEYLKENRIREFLVPSWLESISFSLLASQPLVKADNLSTGVWGGIIYFRGNFMRIFRQQAFEAQELNFTLGLGIKSRPFFTFGLGFKLPSFWN